MAALGGVGSPTVAAPERLPARGIMITGLPRHVGQQALSLLFPSGLRFASFGATSSIIPIDGPSNGLRDPVDGVTPVAIREEEILQDRVSNRFVLVVPKDWSEAEKYLTSKPILASASTVSPIATATGSVSDSAAAAATSSWSGGTTIVRVSGCRIYFSVCVIPDVSCLIPADDEWPPVKRPPFRGMSASKPQHAGGGAEGDAAAASGAAVTPAVSAAPSPQKSALAKKPIEAPAAPKPVPQPTTSATSSAVAPKQPRGAPAGGLASSSTAPTAAGGPSTTANTALKKLPAEAPPLVLSGAAAPKSVKFAPDSDDDDDDRKKGATTPVAAVIVKPSSSSSKGELSSQSHRSSSAAISAKAPTSTSSATPGDASRGERRPTSDLGQSPLLGQKRPRTDESNGDVAAAVGVADPTKRPRGSGADTCRFCGSSDHLSRKCSNKK